MTPIESPTSSHLMDQQVLNDFIRHAAEIEHPREMIIDVLRAIQSHYGWVPDAGVELTASILGLTPMEVEEIATFYDKIFRRPVGRFVIHLCDSVCCWSRGGEEIANHLQKTLDVSFGQTTTDGLFTLLPSCCLGCCGIAPALMIDQQFYGPLTPESVDELLAGLRKERTG